MQNHAMLLSYEGSVQPYLDGAGRLVVPTISFRLLCGLLIMGHGRRQILWFGVTAHWTSEWIANQVTEACRRECLDHVVVFSERHHRHVLLSNIKYHNRGTDAFLG
jgi:hypothetical protein